MSEVMSWGPIVWSLRIVLLLLVFLVSWVVCWYGIRFFRPSNLKLLWHGELPALEEVRLLGTSVRVQEQKANDLHEMVSNIEGRVTDLEDRFNRTIDALQDAVVSQGATSEDDDD